MKKTGLIFLIFLAAVLSACSTPNHRVYANNRSLWEAQGIQHYRFNFEIGCNCPWYDMMPVAVEVQNGEIVSMVASNGGDISPYLDIFEPHATIERLFDMVDSVTTKWVYKLEIQYDASYGFPTLIIIDPSRMVYDDETGYYVTDFEVLP